MKTYKLKPNLAQVYNNYTSEDQTVWETLFSRQMNLLNELAAPEFLEALKKIGFTPHKIPDFAETNSVLAQHTGWKLEVVEGIISEPDFFDLLSKKQFPATTWLRKMSELDYLPEPDMFHDVFGHVPLLIDKRFADFFESFGKLGVIYKNEPHVIQMLGRLYWFTIEFGLVKSPNGMRIYGAGILSSHGESKYALSAQPEHLPFDAVTVMNTAFENDKIQNKYFVIDDLEQLYCSIVRIEQAIAESRALIEKAN